MCAAVLEGWLEKQGRKGFRKNKWSKRWFVLRENKLLYYKQRADLEPAGFVDLFKVCFHKDIPLPISSF